MRRNLSSSSAVCVKILLAKMSQDKIEKIPVRIMRDLQTASAFPQNKEKKKRLVEKRPLINRKKKLHNHTSQITFPPRTNNNNKEVHHYENHSVTA